MRYLDSLKALVADPDTASAWTSWLASGQAGSLPAPLGELEVQMVDGSDREPPVPVSVEQVHVRRRFQHPDGSVWEHLVAESAGADVYVQRLTRDTSVRGTVAVFGDARVYVWVDGPGGEEPPDAFRQLYDLLDAR